MFDRVVNGLPEMMWSDAQFCGKPQRHGHLAPKSPRFARWVFLFLPAAAVQIHAEAYFTLVDFWLLSFALYQVARSATYLSTVIDRQHFTAYFIIFLAYIGLISFGFIYAPDNWGVFKELAKWIEIFVVSVGVIIYVSNDRKFSNLYWAMVFTLLGICIDRVLVNVVSGEPFGRIFVPVDWIVALTIPFLEVFWVRVGFITIVIPSLILSYSRLSWASSTLIVAAFGFLASTTHFPARRIGKILTVGLLITGFFFVIFPEFRQIVSSRIAVTFNPYRDQSAFTRGAMAEAAIADLREHPILGIGAGNFKYHVITAQNNMNFWLAPAALPNSPHSVLLQTGGELGIVGLTVFCLLLVIVILGVRRGGVAIKNNDPMRRYAIGMTLFTIPILVTLVASNIGELYRVIWGLYFGLAISMLNLRRIRMKRCQP